MPISHFKTASGIGAGLAMILAASPALAQDAPSPTDGQVLYAIQRDSGELMRYHFDSQTLMSVGTISGPASAAMTGIDASAHIPGHQNIYGFWTDPSDGQTKLIYIDCETAAASVLGAPLGAGVMTGATSVKTPEGGWVFPNPDGSQPILDEFDWTIFAIHQVEAESSGSDHVHADGNCSPASGTININPNNSPHNEFTVALPGGDSFNRDDLHDKNIELSNEGVFYSGAAESVWVKPKGNGNQNTLTHNGEVYPLENGKTYLISGDDMQISVYNDHIHSNGKAMGHWWVSIDGGCVKIEEENEQAADALQTLLVGLYQVDHKTGQSRHLMALSRSYDGLATTDGGTFLATSGDEIYAIDPTNQSEVLVGTSGLNETLGLEFLGSTLLGFENNNDRLVAVDALTGQPLGAGMSIGIGEVGSIIFTDSPSDPMNVPHSYD